MAEAHRSRRARGAWPLLLAAVALPVAGAVLMSTASGGASGSDRTVSPGVARSTPSVSTARAAAASPSAPAPQPSGPGVRPDAVVVPALGVRAAVSPITSEGGALDPPSDPLHVGWWSGGNRPGSRHGAAVLTGHTVHSGGGAFDDLEQLAPGDDVFVWAGRTRLAYDVTSVRVLSRAALARENRHVFGPSGRARLVLITCEDWDGAVYRSNVVVMARPVA